MDFNLPCHNAFLSHIPSSIGHLKNLESLDLPMNSLSGKIPIELISLSFLAVLNLSFNHLKGPIPIGTQIQSFEADSFEGNDGLNGPPLTKMRSFGTSPVLPSSASSESNSKSSIDWNFLSVELGFIWKIFPQLDFEYELHEGKNYI